MAIVDPFDSAPTSSVTVSGIVDPFETQATQPTQQDKLSNFSYIANQAKLGLADSAVLGQSLIDTFAIQPFKGLITGEKQPTFGENVKRLQKAAGTLTGATEETKAPGALAEIAGGGVRMLSDPLGYLGTGLFKTGAGIVSKVADLPVREILTEAGQAVTQAIPRAAGLFGMGVTSSTGGILGEATEKQLTGQDTGTGKALGQVAGIVPGIATSTAIETSISSLTNMAKQLKSKYDMVKADPDAASQAYASGAAKRFLELVSETMPSGNIDKIMTEFNRIGNKIGTGDIPLFVSMSDNPLVQSEVARLVKSKEGAGIRQQFDTEIKSILGKIDESASDLFGSRYTPVKGTTTPLTTQINKNMKLREAVDTKLDDITSRFQEQDLEQIGSDANRLLDIRSKAAKAEMTPLYDDIKASAAKAGAVLPDTGVRDIYSFVQANNMQDIFGRGTPMDKLIQKNFGPIEGEFYPASFKDVISLKEEINRVQRSVRMDEKMKMRLNDLEDVVDSARQQIKGDFNQRLIDTDRQYYEKIGIPFASQGIKDIDAKKYAVQVAPQIVKNPETMRQFLRAGGNDAVTIADNAIMAQVYSKVIKNGELDARALDRFIKDKSAVLDQLPQTRKMLEASLFDDSVLKLKRVELDDKIKVADKQIADNFILSVKDSDGVAIPNYSEVAGRLFTDPNFFGKITKDLENVDKRTSKAVIRNIQAEVVERARNSTTGGVEFLTSPKNKAVVDKIFGKGYQQEVKDLMIISDAMRAADVSKISSVVDPKNLDVLAKIAPGLDIPYVTSTLRDRISSTFQKGVRLISRAKTAQLKTDTDAALKELLLDRDGLKKLQAIKNTMDFKLQSPTSMKKISETIGTIVPRYMYGAVKEEVLSNDPVALPNTTPQFGEFEQQ
jgi:hypothetical protein